MARRMIVGDIHAQFKLLEEVLCKACFNPEEDILYSVGDLCDRGHKAGSTLKYLMSLNDFRPVLGNHDLYLEYYLCRGIADEAWLRNNGGKSTRSVIRYTFTTEEKSRLRRWISEFPIIRIEEDAIIMHGGIPSLYSEKDLESIASSRRPVPLLYSPEEDTAELEEFCWDRSYLLSAMSDAGIAVEFRINDFIPPIKTERTIFIGHTPIESRRPFISEKYHLVALDTGAGSGEGPLTLMDMDTREYWQAGPGAASG